MIASHRAKDRLEHIAAISATKSKEAFEAVVKSSEEDVSPHG